MGTQLNPERLLNFTDEELERLHRDPLSCVLLERSVRHIALPPDSLKNLKESAKHYLNNSLSNYDLKFNGFLLAYRNFKLKSKIGSTVDDDCSVHVNIKADFYIFMPKQGCELQGIVNKKSPEHIGCLVHKIFHVTIPLSKIKHSEKWKSIQTGYSVKFVLKMCDFTGNLPYMRGKLISFSPPVKSDLSMLEEEEQDEENHLWKSVQTKRKRDPNEDGDTKKNKRRKKDKGDGSEPQELHSIHLTSEDPEYDSVIEHIKESYLSDGAKTSDVKEKKSKKRKLNKHNDSGSGEVVVSIDKTEQMKNENKKQKRKQKHSSETEDEKKEETKLGFVLPDAATLLKQYKEKTDTFVKSLNSPVNKKHETSQGSSENNNSVFLLKEIEPPEKKKKKNKEKDEKSQISNEFSQVSSKSSKKENESSSSRDNLFEELLNSVKESVKKKKKDKDKHNIENTEPQKKRKKSNKNTEGLSDTSSQQPVKPSQSQSNKSHADPMKETIHDADRFRRETSVDSMIITPNVAPDEVHLLKKHSKKGKSTKKSLLDTSAKSTLADGDASSDKESVKKPVPPITETSPYYLLGESMANSADRKRMKVKKNADDMPERRSLPILPFRINTESPEPQENEKNNNIGNFEELLTPLSPPSTGEEKLKKSVTFNEGGKILTPGKSSSQDIQSSKADINSATSPKRKTGIKISPKASPSKNVSQSQLENSNSTEKSESSTNIVTPNFNSLLKLLDRKSPSKSSNKEKTSDEKEQSESPTSKKTTALLKKSKSPSKSSDKSEQSDSSTSEKPNALSRKSKSPSKSSDKSEQSDSSTSEKPNALSRKSKSPSKSSDKSEQSDSSTSKKANTSSRKSKSPSKSSDENEQSDSFTLKKPTALSRKSKSPSKPSDENEQNDSSTPKKPNALSRKSKSPCRSSDEKEQSESSTLKKPNALSRKSKSPSRTSNEEETSDGNEQSESSTSNKPSAVSRKSKSPSKSPDKGEMSGKNVVSGISTLNKEEDGLGSSASQKSKSKSSKKGKKSDKNSESETTTSPTKQTRKSPRISGKKAELTLPSEQSVSKSSSSNAGTPLQIPNFPVNNSSEKSFSPLGITPLSSEQKGKKPKDKKHKEKEEKSSTKKEKEKNKKKDKKDSSEKKDKKKRKESDIDALRSELLNKLLKQI